MGRWGQFGQKGLVAFAAALLTLLLPAPARAQAWSVGEPLALCVRPVAGENPAAVLRKPLRFDCTTSQTRHGPGSFWVVSRLLDARSTIDTPLRVRTASLWQRAQTLHALHADGTVSQVMVPDAAASRQLHLGALFEYSFPPGTSPIRRLLWRVEDSANLRGIVLGARLATAGESMAANLVMSGIYAGFIGLCLGLLVYNLALWAALHHRFQLAYCVMVATLLVYALSSSGMLGWWIEGLSNTGRLRINYVTLALAGAAALIFARTFFEDRIFSLRLHRLVVAVAVSVALGGFAVLFAPSEWVRLADRLYSVAFLTVPLVVLPILWRAWTARSSYLWLFAIAWAAPIAMAVARALHNVGLIGWSFWLDNSTIFAMAAEALLSSLAIAYRIRLLSLERDRAIERELSARLLAETDSLTGLLNRRAFLSRAIGRSGNQVLLLIDIDHFKRVNDTVGHDGGDEVLQAVARELSATIPPGALLARLGGEEFAILTHLADAPEPDRVLDRLRRAPMPFGLTVTASGGACVGPLACDTDWKQLYRCADQALFGAKAAGRDRAARATALASAA